MNDGRNCIIDILNLIDNLQNRAAQIDEIDNGCLRPFLGTTAISNYNTRPVTFFSCDTTQLSFTYYVNNVALTSNVFRIENVGDTCVTVRLLTQNDDGSFSATNETALINIDCICAVKCLSDVNLTF